MAKSIGVLEAKIASKREEFTATRTLLQQLKAKEESVPSLLSGSLNGAGIDDLLVAIQAFRRFISGDQENPVRVWISNPEEFGEVLGVPIPAETAIAWLVSTLPENNTELRTDLYRLVAAGKNLDDLLAQNSKAVTNALIKLEQRVISFEKRLKRELSAIPTLETRVDTLKVAIGDLQSQLEHMLDLEKAEILKLQEEEARRQEEHRRKEEEKARAARELEIERNRMRTEKIAVALGDAVGALALDARSFDNWYTSTLKFHQEFGDLADLVSSDSRDDKELFRLLAAFFNVFGVQEQRRQNHCYKKYSSIDVSKCWAIDIIKHLCLNHLHWPLGEIETLVVRHDKFLTKRFSLKGGNPWTAVSNMRGDGEEIVKNAIWQEIESMRPGNRP